jgi:hypothetical protein
MDSENSRTKIGGRYAEGSEFEKENSKVGFGSAEGKASAKENQREIPNYL